jgi:hypothetical protein
MVYAASVHNNQYSLWLICYILSNRFPNSVNFDLRVQIFQRCKPETPSPENSASVVTESEVLASLVTEQEG